MSGPLGFLASNAHLIHEVNRCKQEIRNSARRWNQIAAKTFFGLYLNLGAKFRTELELLSFTKLRKKVRLLGIC